MKDINYIVSDNPVADKLIYFEFPEGSLISRKISDKRVYFLTSQEAQNLEVNSLPEIYKVAPRLQDNEILQMGVKQNDSFSIYFASEGLRRKYLHATKGTRGCRVV